MKTIVYVFIAASFAGPASPSQITDTIPTTEVDPTPSTFHSIPERRTVSLGESEVDSSKSLFGEDIECVKNMKEIEEEEIEVLKANAASDWLNPVYGLEADFDSDESWLDSEQTSIIAPFVIESFEAHTRLILKPLLKALYQSKAIVNLNKEDTDSVFEKSLDVLRRLRTSFETLHQMEMVLKRDGSVACLKEDAIRVVDTAIRRLKSKWEDREILSSNGIRVLGDQITESNELRLYDITKVSEYYAREIEEVQTVITALEMEEAFAAACFRSEIQCADEELHRESNSYGMFPAP
jgi:hypothetical protein